jgi:DNA repair protein RadC
MSKLLAPNGKPSNLTPEQYKLVRTPEFKKWFGDWENDPANASKVVDENGEPLIMYHGSLMEFNFFDKEYWGYNTFADIKGFFFTNGKEEAEAYMEENVIFGGTNNKIGFLKECFLNLKDPIIQTIWDEDEPSLYIDNQIHFVKHNKGNGLIVKNQDKNWITSVVFEPEQIKLADGTNTTFDGNNPDIRFDGGGETKNKIMEKQMKINFDNNYAEGSETIENKKHDNITKKDTSQKINTSNWWIGYGKGGGVKSKINRKYKYFAQNKQDGKIYNGWEIVDDVESLKHFAKLDLKDNDLKPSDFNIVSAQSLIKKGIDPYDSDNWYKIQYIKETENKEKEFDDAGTSMVLYHEKKGNPIIPKGQIYLWLYDVEDSANKLQSEEFDWVFYPYVSQNMAWQSGYIPPLQKIWTKKFQKQHKGSEHLLGVIKAYLIDKQNGEKELFVDMMSVNPNSKKKGIMSYMLKDLRDSFNLTQDQVTFSKLTPEGEKFVAKKTYADGGDLPNSDKMFHLPLEMVVYVPSTQDVDNVISVDEMNSRVNEVKTYLAGKFGGYSASDKLGGFVDSKGNLVNEEVVQVTAFATEEAYAEHKEELINQIAKWGKDWGQEAIGFEFEGDLMYVPQELDNETKYNEYGRGGFVGLKVRRKNLRGGYNNYEIMGYDEMSEKYRLKDLEKDLTISATTKELKNEFEFVDKYEDGGEAAEYQIIDKKTEKYYSLSMSDGKIKWNDSPDMGYKFTMKDANQIKESLLKTGYEQVEVVKYDSNWWQKAKYEKGGAIYPDLSLQKADVVNDSVELNEFEIKKIKNTFKIDGIEKLRVTSSQDAVNILRKLFSEDTINAYEQAYILYLNKNNKVIGYYHHSSGGVDGTVMDVQMISGMALKSLAKGVIIAHNHPSENTLPSDADKTVTNKLKNALSLFNILLIDSIILTDDSFFSFANDGLI